MALQVLLAEDDALVAMGLADALRAEGHDVMVTGDGRQALAAAQRLPVLDLLITDLRMPHMSGQELIRALWTERPRLPVVVVTTRGDEGSRARALSAGATRFMTKPFDPEGILTCARSVLGDRAAQHG